MKTQWFLSALTAINLGLLLFQLARMTPVRADAIAPVLRARALEIVDEKGRARASIQVYPSAKGYPETALLRLIDQNGRPSVKLSASERGAVLALGGAADPTYVVLKGEGAETELKMTNKDGRQRVVQP